MPGVSNHQNNDIASQHVSLPIAYLNYLSQKSTSINSDLVDNVVFANKLHVFPGIEIKDRDEENIIVSINRQALPFYYQSIQAQTALLKALRTLELISKLSTDDIEPEFQKKNAQSIHAALTKCLCLTNNEYFKLRSEFKYDPVADIIVQLSRIMAVLVITTAGLLLFLPMASAILLIPLVIPPLLAIVASAVIVAGLTAFYVSGVIQCVMGIFASTSALKQAKVDHDKLVKVIETVNLEIDNLSLKTPDVEEKQPPFSAASGSSNHKLYGSRSGSPTIFQQQSAPANGSFEQSDADQENTATTAVRP